MVHRGEKTSGDDMKVDILAEAFERECVLVCKSRGLTTILLDINSSSLDIFMSMRIYMAK